MMDYLFASIIAFAAISGIALLFAREMENKWMRMLFSFLSIFGMTGMLVILQVAPRMTTNTLVYNATNATQYLLTNETQSLLIPTDILDISGGYFIAMMGVISLLLLFFFIALFKDAIGFLKVK